MSFDVDLASKFGAEISLLADPRLKPDDRLEATGLLATLLLLRWSEVEEAEFEACAAFDESSYEKKVPQKVRYESWAHLRGGELARYFEHRVIPALHLLKGGDPITHRLGVLGKVLNRLMRGAERALDPVMGLVSSVDFASPDGRSSAGFAVETFIGLSAGGARQGFQNYTPPPVADLMLELGAPKPGERIYDPCFGLGGLLLGSARRLVESAKTLSPRIWSDLRRNSLFGVETAPVPFVIGLARVVFAGITEPGLELGDALERETDGLFGAERFDLVLANPPWGARHGGESFGGERTRTERFRFRSRNLESLFLQHVADSLRPGGRAVIAVPEGILSRRGPESELRQWLLRQFRVEGVISLPAGTFSPCTGIKANLLLLHRDAPGMSVRFLTVRNLAGSAGGSATNAEGAAEVARRFRSKKPGEHHWDAPLDELAARGWDLTAAPPSQRRLEREIEEIQREDASIGRRELGEVAEIFVGLTSARETTARERPLNGGWLPLVRGRDVREGRVGEPSLFLVGDATRPLERFRLKAGDIVFPRIGRGVIAAPVPESLYGAIAESSVMVIRPNPGEVSGDYLAALLNSERYQLWLQEGSSALDGALRISVEMLRRTPLPVPNLLDQTRIGRLWRDGEPVDALRLLTQRSDYEEVDPLSRWLAKSSEARALLQAEPGASSGQLFLLDQFGHACRQARNQFAHGVAGDGGEDGVLGPAWPMVFFETLLNLRGVSKIPPGPTLLSILESVRTSAARSVLALRKQRKHAKVGGLAFSVAERVEELLIAQKESLLSRVEFEARIDPGQVEPGQRSEVVLRLVNRSPLALRLVQVNTTQPVGRAQVDFLDQGAEIAVPLSIDAPNEPGTISFDARWRADRIDGRTVSGSLQVAVEVRPPHRPPEATDLGASPYIVGNPVNRKEMFFGREDVIERIKGQLSTEHRANVILLEGNRRAGKTSILRRLAEAGELPGWVVVYCSFQGGEGATDRPGLPTSEVFRLIARDIGWEASKADHLTWFPGYAPPDPSRSFRPQFAAVAAQYFKTERPAEAFQVYLESALEACRPSRILLLLDEFDKLQEGIDAGITSPQVPENLRYLLHEYSDLSAVLSGSRRLKRLREEYWSALFGIGHRIGVSALSLEAARELVTRPVSGRLAYAEDARDHLADLCARQPFLVQSLCNRVFENASRKGNPTVTVTAVDEAARDLVEDNEHFQTLWGYAKSDRRRLLLSLCDRLSEGPDPVTFGLIETKLDEHRVPFPGSDALSGDIEFLRELELLELVPGEGRSDYRLGIPLMANWIRRHTDFEDLVHRAAVEGEESEGE